jgi:hypothetical protein
LYTALFRAGIEAKSPESHEAQAKWLEDLQRIARPFALSKFIYGATGFGEWGPPNKNE